MTLRTRREPPRETPRETPRARRRAILGLLLGAGLLLGPAAPPPLAQELTFFRIGTGSTSGTYFPVGGLIAGAISNPPGSRSCERGGSCGVPGMIAVVQSTTGSVANLAAIAGGEIESGFSQADVAFWARTGTQIYAGEGPNDRLRAIANLYPESLHLVVRRGLPIRTVADLRGKRVSLDREGSGSRVDALLVLDAYGLGPDDLDVVSVEPGLAADMLRAGELDAFFMVVGTPADVVSGLAADSLVTLLPIDGPEAESLRALYPFFAEDRILSGAYFNVPLTRTLSVGAQWVVSADLPEAQVYAITAALWHPTTAALLEGGHPKARLIRLETAREGLGVPLHPGAQRYYDEIEALAAGADAEPKGSE